nr:hypothetical protein [Allomuricauda sp.]
MKNPLATWLTLLFIMPLMAQNEWKVEPAFLNLQAFDKLRDFSMNAEGNEAYLTVQSPNEEVSVIVRMTKNNATWNQPTIASFSGKYKDLEPFLAPDGLRLYFVSNRPIESDSEETKDFDIWYVERETFQSNWSDPINMGAPINTEHNEFYPAVAENGSLYFTCECPGALGRDDIFMSRWVNGSYTKPVALGPQINSEGFEYNAYIAPDDSYLIFGGYNREDGLGSGDLYISFKNEASEWTTAVPLPAPINSRYMDYCPFVDLNNKVLYFTSRRSSVPKEAFEATESLSQFLDAYENGGSRLYKANFDIGSLRKNL